MATDTDGNARVTITIDGQPVSVPAGTNVVDAARTIGIDIPVFCHHPRLEPVGMCRMCLVEVGAPVRDRETGEPVCDENGEPVIRFAPTLVTSCTTVVNEGMVVRTATDVVVKAQRAVLELLLTSHPLDCPVCDKGGECSLQDLTMRHGSGRSRFAWGDKLRFPKPAPCGPLVVLDRERCVLCGRCIRFQDEVAADSVLGFTRRSRAMEVITFSDPPFDSYFAGNATDICPVGALTTKDFRHEARVWEVVSRPGVCVHCAVGCNVTYDERSGRVMRVMPRANEDVNAIWICDKGRFAHHFAAAPDRLRRPLVRRGGELAPASWGDALGVVADRLHKIRDRHGPAAIGGIAGDGVPNEDLYLFGRFLRSVIGSNNVDHRPGIVRDDTIARAGAGEGTTLAALGEGTTVLVVGLDVEEEAPVLFLHLFKAARNGAQVIVLGGRPQKLDSHATAVLRYRYGAEDSLLAALLGGVLERAGDGLVVDVRGLREALGPIGSEVLPGVHPIRNADLDRAVAAIAGAQSLLVLFGREAAALGLVQPAAALVSAMGHIGRANSGLLAVGPHANSQGAADMGLLPDWLPGYRRVTDPTARAALAAHWPAPPPKSPGLDAAEMLRGGVRALYVLGTDPAGDDVGDAQALAGLDLLVVQELFPTDTVQRADVVLPARSSLERDGTFTSLMRRVQRFDAAAAPVGESRPGWAILRDLGQRFGVTEAYGSAADVMDEIARAVPIYAGLTYDVLGSPPAPSPGDLLLPFSPTASGRDVVYEGTRYTNMHGRGCVWPLERAGAVGLGWRPRPAASVEDLILVRTTRLYDAGALVAPSRILHPLTPLPHVVMSPFDAGPRGLREGMPVRVASAHGAIVGELRLGDGLTPGVVLVPEGLAWETPVATVMEGASTVGVTVEPA